MKSDAGMKVSWDEAVGQIFRTNGGNSSGKC